MTDADAFLEAIWANPDDDLPRLVYADWLEEHGEVDYAALIRINHKLDRTGPMAPSTRKTWRRLRHDLRGRVIERLTALLPGLDIYQTHFDNNGILGHPAVEAVEFISWRGDWPSFLPSRVALTSYFGHETNLVECPNVTGFSRLTFLGSLSSLPPYPPVTDSLFRALIASNRLDRLVELRVTDIYPSRASLLELANSPLMDRLSAIHFEYPSDPIYHKWVDIIGRQPPVGGNRKALLKFLSDYAVELPAD